MYPLLSKTVICGLFGFSRQAWYDNKKRQSELQMQEVFILKQVKELRGEHKRMGAEKLHRLMTPMLREHNIKYGRDKFYFLLREHGLLVKRRRRGPKTTNSKHFYRKYPNLIREIELLSSGRLWVSDITYIRTEKGFVYLSLITDAYSKKIVGWCLWPDLTSQGALNALKMAIALAYMTSFLSSLSSNVIWLISRVLGGYILNSSIKKSLVISRHSSSIKRLLFLFAKSKRSSIVLSSLTVL